MKRSLYCGVVFAIVALAISTVGVRAQESAEKKAPGPAAAVLAQWNGAGNRLVAMAEDWPEAKYSYRPNEQVRTFAQVLLHIAGSNYSLVNQIQGKKLGNEENDPSTEVFKSKAQVVEFLKKSVADGAAAIQQAGDAGVLKHLEDWIGYTEHMGEHYGQLVVYYRNNGVVPPESRPKK